ncbi:(2Fe-2S)-binding protein [Paenibacillus sp. IB182496]|uniref:(2Fe-2S)-binding protein n=1 Tax=Paenibacillus sabuli TaxID=2772509 RepID=A0A927GSY3_9BACL|nr:(2Fe-2S)-binding protein [Paenibacillus sabuli]MBD2846766.1 (2Fe-2S)-binding protein [Paenibacillus sabuli]
MIDYAVLESKFYIVTVERPNARLSASLAELSCEAGMAPFLDTYGQLIKATAIEAPAAYLAGMLGTLGAGLQACLSLMNRDPGWRAETVVIQLCKEGDYYSPVFLVRRAANPVAGPLEQEAREGWLTEAFGSFYGAMLRPILEAASSVSGLPIHQLWGQLPTRLNYSVPLMTDFAGVDQAVADRVNRDYDFLKTGLQPMDCFGRAKNPLNVRVRWIESLYEPERQMRMKNACCQYYQIEGGSYCYTCPRLKESEREARRTRHRAEAALQSAGAK